MASFVHSNINPGLFGKIFRLECPVDRVSFFREFDMMRDIYRVDLNRMFNNQKMKLECPKMAITPGVNSFNETSYSYSNDVWDIWSDRSTTSSTSNSTVHADTMSQTVSATWTTWVRDQYIYYYDVETRYEQNRVHAVWSVWTDDATRALYEGVADEITDGLRVSTEQMGQAFERVAAAGVSAGRAMQNLGDAVRRGQEHRIAEVDRITKMAEKRNAAEAKAKDLLLDIIGKDELVVYEETGRVFVKGRKHDYIVQREGFIQQIDKGKIQDLCASINKNKYPLTDNVVAMKLLIESDEDQFLEIANKQGSRKYDELPKAACM